jgi:hypothetical protein
MGLIMTEFSCSGDGILSGGRRYERLLMAINQSDGIAGGGLVEVSC